MHRTRHQHQCRANAVTPYSPSRRLFSQGSLQHPNDVEFASELAKAVVTLRANGKPDNTVKAFQPKMEEYEQFCDACYPDDNYKYCLDDSKLYRFMYYQAFREKKKAGGNKVALASGTRFDAEEYRSIMKAYSDVGHAAANGMEQIEFPLPSNPISRATFDQYKACMKLIHDDQKAMNVCALPWEMLWKQNCKNLQNHVKERAAMMKRLNYVEKVNGEFSGYTIVERYGEIELALWEDSNTTAGRRAVCSNIRHRTCLLMLVSGILRSESLHRAEISNFLSIRPPKREYDIHDIFIQIQQICEGKTNHGQTLYGRALRHKDVRLCAVGAAAIYLNYREDCTKEFLQLTIANWLNNEDWFDIKFLTDIYGADNRRPLRNDTYGRHIKRTLRKLNIICAKIQHLGRNLGTKILDLLEEEAAEIKRMGQWNPSIMDNSYSSKLPIGPMRKLAGFHSENKMYFNTRTTVRPSNSLKRKTPLGKFSFDMLDALVEQDRSGDHPTAMHVLRYFCELSEVLLQDAAVMSVVHGRGDHPLFCELEVFQCPEWQEYLSEMRTALENERSPLDATLESVLPGVHQWHRANEAAVKRVHGHIDALMETVKEGLKDGFDRISSTTAFNQQLQDQRLATVFADIAKGLLQGSVTQPTIDSTSVTHMMSPNSRTCETTTTNAEFSMEDAADETPPSYEITSYRLPSKPLSLEDLWNSWHGCGQHHCQHGGVIGRNKKFGAKWRKHIPPAHYSRCCRSVKAIEAYAKDKRIKVEEAVAHLDPIFQEECGKSVYNFVEKMQEQGMLKKAAKRGKQALTEVRQ